MDPPEKLAFLAYLESSFLNTLKFMYADGYWFEYIWNLRY